MNLRKEPELDVPGIRRRPHKFKKTDVTKHLIITNKKRKLKLFGHVVREAVDWLEKEIIQGYLERRNRETPRRLWMKDVVCMSFTMFSEMGKSTSCQVSQVSLFFSITAFKIRRNITNIMSFPNILERADLALTSPQHNSLSSPAPTLFVIPASLSGHNVQLAPKLPARQTITL